MVNPAYGVDQTTGKNLLAAFGSNSDQFTVQMTAPITHTGTSWYGQDFIVFSNQGFTGKSGFASEGTDMSAYQIADGSTFGDAAPGQRQPGWEDVLPRPAVGFRRIPGKSVSLERPDSGPQHGGMGGAEQLFQAREPRSDRSRLCRSNRRERRQCPVRRLGGRDFLRLFSAKRP